ncbi:hypothetical protein OG884_26625 [Streptosporangium sp. NBC_01755]|uniref:hypothetical protein n=1 Tax=Streptosporangium sp. NBC_01755 TaxID=2975949 RepID=UPI002DDA197B|nr:hypothetical protein [Streptosporangium sp. NBC_01755]WSC98425.1 hypothetical protein OG884_26625 [Streptosporangium sp. NBC_01755]
MTAFTQPDAGWAATPLTGLAGAIATSVVQTVLHAGAHAPRSLQRVIGPSEIGMPCTRRMAYKLCDHPAANTSSDPWASIIGTAVHSWMEQTYAAENARLGRERYVIERRLHIRGNVYGHADLYDRDLKVNNDWKVVGPDRLKDYRSKGPGPQYEIQAHLYGLGQENAGEQVEHVAITFLPRGGRIDGLHVWTAPYDRSIALGALERMDNVLAALTALDPPNNPTAWAMFPATEAYCTYCPFFLPGSTDLSAGCPGTTTK